MRAGQQLLLSTFREQAVAAVLSKDMVPVRILAEEQERLVEALRVRSYPMLIVADADGRILGSRAGFMAPEKLQPWLREVLAKKKQPAAPR